MRNAKYFFGDLSRFAGGAAAPEASEYHRIGRTLHTMKTALNPHGSGIGGNTGKYLGKDLAWWKDNTQHVLDASVLAFDPDAEANEVIDKLKQICDAEAAERTRHIHGGKVDWVDVVPSGSGSGAAGGFRIRRITDKTQYFFGDLSRFAGEAAAPEASEYHPIGRTLHNMKTALNPHGSGKGVNKSKTYLGKDLVWWREHTQHVLDPSVLAFDPDAGTNTNKVIDKLKQHRHFVTGGEVSHVGASGDSNDASTSSRRRQWQQ